MAAKERKQKKTPIRKSVHYRIEGDEIIRDREFCPKCGPGTFLAVHAQRRSCGRCGYTEFESDVKQPGAEPAAEPKAEPAAEPEPKAKPKAEPKKKPKAKPKKK